MPEKKTAVSKAAAAKPAPKAAPAKKAAAPQPRREAKKEPPKPVKAAKAPPKAAPATKAAKPAPAAKAAPAPKSAPIAKKAETKPAAKPSPKVEPKAKAAPSKPEPKKAAAKAAPEPKKSVAKGKPLAADTKAKPAPAPRVEKPAPPPKPEKPAKAAKPPKPEKPPKPPKLAPVAAALAKPMPAKPMAVAAGRAQPITRTPVTPIRATPKPLAAPKPVAAEPELVGESQAVPAFKAKAPDKKGLVLVGAIAGAFGVKGEVRLRAFTDKKEGVISYGPLYSEDGKILLKPKSWRELKDGVAIIAAEVKSREQAEKMKGQKLFVPRANLPATAEDEFYVVDLLGSRAEMLDGTVLGDIVAVWNFGAGDILEYKPPNGGPNVRITFTRETVPHVDLAAKRVVIDPPAPEPMGK